MFEKLWYKLNNTVTGGAVMIALFSLLAKIIALFRERLIASSLGASQLSDIYYAAFRLPDFIFNTLILGALSSSFIPVFQKVWLKDKNRGLNLGNSVINFFLLMIIVLVAIAFVLAAPITKLLTPGFDTWALGQTIQLTRVMLLATIFFVVSNVFSGMLNSWKKFFSFSLAASFYNIGIIIGITVFFPHFGLIGLAYGVLLGAAMHCLVQLPELIKNGWRYRLLLHWSVELKKILKLMIPRTIGSAATQVNLMVITMIGSMLPVGSIAVFNFANNLQSLPISLFAVSMAVAVFPTFTQAVSEERHDIFVNNLTTSLRRILFLLIPVSIFLVVLRAQVVRILLGTGNFNWENTYYTAQALGCFSISIFAQGLIPLLAPAYYAQGDTKTPTFVGISSIVLNIILSWFLAVNWQMGVLGLALAYSISSIINMLVLYLILHYRLPDIDDNLIISSLLKISFNSLVAGAVVYMVFRILAPLVDMRSFVGILVQGLGAGLCGLIIYLILGILLKLDEMILIKEKMFKTWRFLKNGKN